MANAITTNPWIIDTASASADIVTKTIKITKIIWDGVAVAAADTAILTNSANVVVFSVQATTTNLGPMTFDFPTDPGFLVQGLRCSALGHGKLYIWVVPSSM